jgi:hypothetical protein
LGEVTTEAKEVEAGLRVNKALDVIESQTLLVLSIVSLSTQYPTQAKSEQQELVRTGEYFLFLLHDTLKWQKKKKNVFLQMDHREPAPPVHPRST